MLNDLIQNLAGQAGVDNNVAGQALGAIFKTAESNVSPELFSQLTSKVPDVTNLMSSVGTSGGLGGIAGAAMSAFGGEKAGAAMQLISTLKGLNLDLSTVTKWAPTIMKFVEGQGAGGLATELQKLMGSLTE